MKHVVTWPKIVPRSLFALLTTPTQDLLHLTFVQTVLVPETCTDVQLSLDVLRVKFGVLPITPMMSLAQMWVSIALTRYRIVQL
jgi:hypothetical protein